MRAQRPLVPSSVSTASRRMRRVALAVATAAALGLALVSGASAAFKPLFTATGTSDSVTVSYSQNSSNDGTAALTLYASADVLDQAPDEGRRRCRDSHSERGRRRYARLDRSARRHDPCRLRRDASHRRGRRDHGR